MGRQTGIPIKDEYLETTNPGDSVDTEGSNNEDDGSDDCLETETETEDAPQEIHALPEDLEDAAQPSTKIMIKPRAQTTKLQFEDQRRPTASGVPSRQSVNSRDHGDPSPETPKLVLKPKGTWKASRAGTKLLQIKPLENAGQSTAAEAPLQGRQSAHQGNNEDLSSETPKSILRPKGTWKAPGAATKMLQIKPLSSAGQSDGRRACK